MSVPVGPWPLALSPKSSGPVPQDRAGGVTIAFHESDRAECSRADDAYGDDAIARSRLDRWRYARSLSSERVSSAPARATASPRIRASASPVVDDRFVISAAYGGRPESTESTRRRHRRPTSSSAQEHARAASEVGFSNATLAGDGYRCTPSAVSTVA
jgi:hypothetical protein